MIILLETVNVDFQHGTISILTWADPLISISLRHWTHEPCKECNKSYQIVSDNSYRGTVDPQFQLQTVLLQKNWGYNLEGYLENYIAFGKVHYHYAMWVQKLYITHKEMYL